MPDKFGQMTPVALSVRNTRMDRKKNGGAAAQQVGQQDDCKPPDSQGQCGYGKGFHSTHNARRHGGFRIENKPRRQRQYQYKR